MRRTGLSRTAAEHALRRLEMPRGRTRPRQHRIANQRRHAHNARTGRQLTPLTTHHGIEPLELLTSTPPRYTVPDSYAVTAPVLTCRFTGFRILTVILV